MVGDELEGFVDDGGEGDGPDGEEGVVGDEFDYAVGEELVLDVACAEPHHQAECEHPH